MDALFTMKIRRAFRKDAVSLAEIEKEYPQYPAWGKKGLEAEFKNKYAVTLLAEDENGTRGFVNFWILPPSIQINAIVVSRAALRNKIASGLMKKVLEYAKKNSYQEIDIEVNIKNGAAISFYDKMGFNKVGQRAKFYNEKDDAVLMKFKIFQSQKGDS